MNIKRATLIGILLAGLSIFLHTLLEDDQQMEWMSALMVLIGSVYFGFAFKESRKTTRIIEISIATLFVSMGILGLWISPWILFTALLLHGIWDLLHHRTNILAEIPRWYIPFCATYDWVMATYLYYTLI